MAKINKAPNRSAPPVIKGSVVDQSPVSDTRLNELIDVAVKTLQEVSRSTMIAYSGGKDSIALGLIMDLAGFRWPMVCETSFYFDRQIQDIAALAQARGRDLRTLVSLDWAFIRAHPHMVFSDDTKVRGWTYAMRQQRAMKNYAAKHGHDVQVFGRRTQENCVPAVTYKTKAGVQCHPLREWKTPDVWALLRRCNVPMPWIYSTPFGKIEAWALVESLDPQFRADQLT